MFAGSDNRVFRDQLLFRGNITCFFIFGRLKVRYRILVSNSFYFRLWFWCLCDKYLGQYANLIVSRLRSSQIFLNMSQMKKIGVKLT